MTPFLKSFFKIFGKTFLWCMAPFVFFALFVMARDDGNDLGGLFIISLGLGLYLAIGAAIYGFFATFLIKHLQEKAWFKKFKIVWLIYAVFPAMVLFYVNATWSFY